MTHTDPSLDLVASIHDRMPRPFMILEAGTHEGRLDFRYVYANEAAESLFPLRFDDPWLSSLPADGPSAIAMYRQILDTQEPYSSQVSYVLDGQSRLFDIHRVPMSDTRVAVSIVEITDTVQEEARLERERELLRQQLDQSPLAISTIDVQDYRYVQINEAHTRMVGRPIEPGTTFREAFPELRDDDPLLAILDQVASTGVPYQVAAFPGIGFAANGDKTDTVYQFTIHPLCDPAGNVILLQCVAAEVTGLHAAKERAEALSARLDDTHRWLTAAQRVGRVGVYEFQPDTGDLTFSDELRALYGLGPDDPMNTLDDWAAHCHPDDLQSVYNMLEDATQHRLPHTEYEFRIRHEDGWIWINGRGSFEYRQDGTPYRMVGTNYDITSHKRVEQQLAHTESRFRSTFENSVIGMAHLAVDGTWLAANARVLEVFDATKDDLASRTLLDRLHPEGAATLRNEITELLAGERSQVKISTRFDRGADSWGWAEISMTFHSEPAGGPGWLVVILDDITTRIHTEQQLREASDHKDDFLAMLGHELRNPVSAIALAGRALDAVESPDDRTRFVVGVLERQTSHIARMLTDLLDITRLATGKTRLECESTDLLALVRTVAHDLKPNLVAKRHHLHLQLPKEGVVLKLDGVRTTQVLTNLLQNAIKYTPDGGDLRVRVRPTNVDVTIEVEDDGVGIPPELVTQVFEPFRQAPQDLDRADGGLGLGLAVARGLVELHGGTLTVQSPGRGRGSLFRVVLPRTVYQTDMSPIPASPRAAEGRVVMIIEDNRDAAVGLRMLLEDEGHVVHHAPTGEEGLRLCAELTPDVVFCDIGLPGMDGIELGHRLTALPEAHRMHRIALSGYGSAEDIAATRKAGYAQHLVKPADADAILSAMARPDGRPSTPPGGPTRRQK